MSIKIKDEKTSIIYNTDSIDDLIKSIYHHNEEIVNLLSSNKHDLQNLIFTDFKFLLGNFNKVNFMGIDFTNMIFNSCTFNECTFSNAKWNNCSFNKSSFIGCTIQNITGSNINLKNTILDDSVIIDNDFFEPSDTKLIESIEYRDNYIKDIEEIINTPQNLKNLYVTDNVCFNYLVPLILESEPKGRYLEKKYGSALIAYIILHMRYGINRVPLFSGSFKSIKDINI